MGMHSVDGVTARLLAEEAVQRLHRLHNWTPAGHAEQTLREPLDHGGFAGQAVLLAEVENLAALDQHGTIPRRLFDGLTAVAECAPLTHGQSSRFTRTVTGATGPRTIEVTALLDFEWARFGEPVDDWFFLARSGSPHMETVLDVIARTTVASLEALRAECEVREAAYLASDLRLAPAHHDAHARMVVDRLRELEELIVGRSWWRHNRYADCGEH
ncbi:hypothetical protein [Streptomyces sp. NPDC059479]|uniref:hypothetical protein n=1 Tax=Streptomyces sp. NPDC059479 TaxID=3346848 RepID=UPI003680FFE5